MLHTILLIVAIIVIIGALTGSIGWGGRTALWGYAPAGGVSTLAVILIVLLVLGVL